MKQVLLARPSSLIVNDMRKLISSAGFLPLPLDSTDELTRFETSEVAGIVISTALSSSVKDKYWEVIKKSRATFPEKPIFLASYASVRGTKITAGQRLKENNIETELLSLDELIVNAFDKYKNILILTKEEISDDVKFPSVLKSVKGILNLEVNV